MQLIPILLCLDQNIYLEKTANSKGKLQQEQMVCKASCG